MQTRLEKLRTTLRLEWGELSTQLGLSRSMLDQVRKGQRNLSIKALRRLEEVERSAGILPPAPPPPTAVAPAQDRPSKNLKISDKGDSEGDALKEIAWLLREATERLDRYLSERDGKL